MSCNGRTSSSLQSRPTLTFAIDGGVVKIDPLALQEDLGVVGGREPRWAIARKFAPDIAETRLLEIRVNTGRTGVLTPYAVLEPVEIGGVTVTNATLHNEDLIKQKDLREGDMVLVKRAGEVIPQIISPIPEKRSGSERPWEMPKQCPACGTPVIREEGDAGVYCPNASCPGRRLESLVHFATAARWTSADSRISGFSSSSKQGSCAMPRIYSGSPLSNSSCSTVLPTRARSSSSRRSPRPSSSLWPACSMGWGYATSARPWPNSWPMSSGRWIALWPRRSEGIADVHGVGDEIAGAVVTYFANPTTPRFGRSPASGRGQFRAAAAGRGGGCPQGRHSRHNGHPAHS